MTRRSSFGNAKWIWRAREGVAAIEFAVVATFLLLLLAWTASLGSLLWAKMQVGNAARAGAAFVQKYGPDNTTDLQNVVASATRLGANVTATPAPVRSCGCPDASAGVQAAACGSQCPNGANAGSYVTVNTQTTYAVLFPLPGLRREVSLTGTAITRR